MAASEAAASAEPMVALRGTWLFRGAAWFVSLTRIALALKDIALKTMLVYSLDDIIGAQLAPNGAVLNVFCLLPTPKGQRTAQTLALEATGHAMPAADECAVWLHALRCVLAGLDPAGAAPAQRRVLLLVNPFGGRKKARQIVADEVVPVLVAANCAVSLVETTHAGHAAELCAALDLTTYDVLAVASGDGLLHEVINSLLWRPDAAAAARKPLAIIPGGTGNALAHSIGASSGLLAAYTIVKGTPSPLDLFSVRSDEGAASFCFALLEWAIISDVDFLSEGNRWMGDLRYDFEGIKRILRLKRYHARLFWEPIVDGEDAGREGAGREGAGSEAAGSEAAAGSEGAGSKAAAGSESAGRERVGREGVGSEGAEREGAEREGAEREGAEREGAEREGAEREGAEREGAEREGAEGAHAPESAGADANTVAAPATPAAGDAAAPASPQSDAAGADSSAPPGGASAALTPAAPAEPHPVQYRYTRMPKTAEEAAAAGWQSMEGSFILFLLSNITHQSKSVLGTPHARISDGACDVVLMREASRLQLLSLFMTLQSGRHVRSPAVQYVKCRALRLDPAPQTEATMGVDGERIPYGAVNVEVHPGLLRLLVVPALVRSVEEAAARSAL